MLYLPARDVIVSEKRDASPAKIESDIQKELRRSGLVLEDAQVLRAMEHDALEKPVYLPITLKKDGTITDGVATAHELGRLGRYTEHLLEQIAGGAGPGQRGRRPGLPHTPGRRMPVVCLCIRLLFPSRQRNGPPPHPEKGISGGGMAEYR